MKNIIDTPFLTVTQGGKIRKFYLNMKQGLINYNRILTRWKEKMYGNGKTRLIKSELCRESFKSSYSK